MKGCTCKKKACSTNNNCLCKNRNGCTRTTCKCLCYKVEETHEIIQVDVVEDVEEEGENTTDENFILISGSGS